MFAGTTSPASPQGCGVAARRGALAHPRGPCPCGISHRPHPLSLGLLGWKQRAAVLGKESRKSTGVADWGCAERAWLGADSGTEIIPRVRAINASR